MTENIYIGSKPVLNYVTALVTAFQREPSVHVFARGRAISSAVDVVEVCKRSFLKNIHVDEIAIGTDQLGDGDDLRNVSTIKITLRKTDYDS
ncbi:MAG: RNA-binding protein [Candidatus Bathyarchaeota archaeon]|nr:RNA-binding protein [Candidatus Bathyarchaeota archaeon]